VDLLSASLNFDVSGFVVLDTPVKYVFIVSSSQVPAWTALKASLSVQCPFSFVLFEVAANQY
jgi:hypothetical protein